MKKIIRIYRTKFSEYPPKWEISLFNSYITICNHFPKVWSWGVEIHYENGCNGLQNFWKYWELGYGNDNRSLTDHFYGKAGKATCIIVRFGKPLFTFHLTKKNRDRAVEATQRYIYSPKTQQYA
jgi:hypothetical protein